MLTAVYKRCCPAIAAALAEGPWAWALAGRGKRRPLWLCPPSAPRRFLAEPVAAQAPADKAA